MPPSINSLTINWDENIKSVSSDVPTSDVSTWSTSGQQLTTMDFGRGASYTFTVSLADGYVLDTVNFVNTYGSGGTLTGQTDTTFTITSDAGGVGGTVTLTSKVAQVVPTFSFKHRYKNTKLIGSGTYKFRPYTVSESVVGYDTPIYDVPILEILSNTGLQPSEDFYISVVSDSKAPLDTLRRKINELPLSEVFMGWGDIVDPDANYIEDFIFGIEIGGYDTSYGDIEIALYPTVTTIEPNTNYLICGCIFSGARDENGEFIGEYQTVGMGYSNSDGGYINTGYLSEFLQQAQDSAATFILVLREELTA